MLCIPVALTLTNVRLLMTPLFPEIEYNLPNFPPDRYGITKAERLYWAKRSIQYILGDPAVGPVEQWKFADSGLVPEGFIAPEESCKYYGNDYGPRDCTYFYNDREVKHMLDVRVIVVQVIGVWIVTAILALLAIGMLNFTGHTASLRLGLLNGAVLTWGILIFLVAFIAIGFNQFFTLFHQVFFAEGTWIFLWSDSFIRLFPLDFWFHAFLFVGVATLAQAALIAAIAWWGMRV
jgi:integral membrane protein (TIGR01906 family)